jgi:hypothetical protein
LVAKLSFAADVKFAWDANTEPDLAGYKLYYDQDGKPFDNEIDVGNVTTYTLTDLSIDTTYFFAVTAYDINGNESGIYG